MNPISYQKILGRTLLWKMDKMAVANDGVLGVCMPESASFPTHFMYLACDFPFTVNNTWKLIHILTALVRIRFIHSKGEK